MAFTYLTSETSFHFRDKHWGEMNDFAQRYMGHAVLDMLIDTVI